MELSVQYVAKRISQDRLAGIQRERSGKGLNDSARDGYDRGLLHYGNLWSRRSVTHPEWSDAWIRWIWKVAEVVVSFAHFERGLCDSVI